MILSQFEERLDDFSLVEREVYIEALIEQLTSVSVRAIAQAWINISTIEEQNNRLRQCIAIERSEIGEAIRASEDLEPLTGSTTIG